MDGDTLTFSLIDPPENAFLDSVTGELTFQPAADFEGAITITAAVSDGVFSSATSANVTVEHVFFLYQNYPNPFQLSVDGKTKIDYQLAGPGDVNLVIYDLLGREVKTLVTEYKKQAGKYTASWNATDNQGRRVSAGIYLYRIHSGNFIDARKLVILK